MSLVLVRASSEPDGHLTVRPDGSVVGSGYLEIELDPVLNRTGDVWHICVDGIRNVASMFYGWRADGPSGGQSELGCGMSPLFCAHPHVEYLCYSPLWRHNGAQN